MNLIGRHILRRCIETVVPVAMASICVPWLIQSPRGIELIAHSGLAIGLFGCLTALALPALTPTAPIRVAPPSHVREG